jgi:hypothetical protein
MVFGKREREACDPRPAGGAARCGARAMKRGWLPLILLLCGCGAAGSWTKPGADAAAAAGAYHECQAAAEEAIKPEIGINEDILATRGIDWERARIGRVESETMRQQTRGRAAAIVASCMRAKGFVESR